MCNNTVCNVMSHMGGIKWPIYMRSHDPYSDPSGCQNKWNLVANVSYWKVNPDEHCPWLNNWSNWDVENSNQLRLTASNKNLRESSESQDTICGLMTNINLLWLLEGCLLASNIPYLSFQILVGGCLCTNKIIHMFPSCSMDLSGCKAAFVLNIVIIFLVKVIFQSYHRVFNSR